MNLTETISLVEVIWILIAFPGLILWSQNAITAFQGYYALTRMGIANGRLTWSKFSRLLTCSLTFVELVYLFIGVVALLSASANGRSLAGYIIVVGLIASSLLVTVVGYWWKDVDDKLLEYAKQRREIDEDQQRREHDLNVREAEQDDKLEPPTVL